MEDYKTMSKIFETLGILYRVSCPYTPQQNGRVERKNSHVVEIGLTHLA